MNTVPNYNDITVSVLGNSQQGNQPLQQTPKEFYHGNGLGVATTPHQPPSYTHPYWGNNISLGNPSNQWQYYNPGTEAYAHINHGYHQYFNPQHDGTFPQQSYFPQTNFNAHVPIGAYNFAYHAHPVPPTPTIPLTLSECKRQRIDSVNPSLKDVLISSPNQFQDYTAAAAASASSVTPRATTMDYPHFSFDDQLKIPNGSWNTTTNHITQQQVNQLTAQTARHYDNVVHNIEPSPLSSSFNYQPFQQNTHQSYSSGSFSTSTPYQELPEQQRNHPSIRNSIHYSAKKAIVSPDQAKAEALNEINPFTSASSSFDENNKGGARGENTLKKDGCSDDAVDGEEKGRVPGEQRRTSADRRALQSKAWYERFEDLKKYKEEHGDCLVPQKYARNPRYDEFRTLYLNIEYIKITVFVFLTRFLSFSYSFYP